MVKRYLFAENQLRIFCGSDTDTQTDRGLTNRQTDRQTLDRQTDTHTEIDPTEIIIYSHTRMVKIATLFTVKTVLKTTANLPSLILICLYMNVKYFPLKDLNTTINGSGESWRTRITLRDYILSVRKGIYNVEDKSTNSQLNIIGLPSFYIAGMAIVCK